MRNVNIAELKNKLSTYVRYARAGETVIIRDRNTPVAQLTPLVANEWRTESEREKQELVAAGILREPERPWDIRNFDRLPKPKLKENALLQALLDEREEGR